MGFFEFIRNHFFENYSYLALTEKEAEQIQIERFAINCGISLIANAVAAAEFVTYNHGKKVKDGEYYLWNVKPNNKQNRNQFIEKAVKKFFTENEVLIFEQKGQLFVADNFNKDDTGLNQDVFTNISVGKNNLDKSLKSKDVIYLSMCNEDFSSLLTSAAGRYSDLLSYAFKKLKKSSAQKGVIKVDAVIGGNSQKDKEANDTALSNSVKKFLDDEDRVLPLRRGMTYEDMSKNRVGDNPSTEINEITKQVFSRVSEAMHIPLGILLGNIAEVEELRDDFITFAVRGNITNQFEAEINAKRYNENSFKDKTFLKINTNRIYRPSLLKCADDLYNLLGSGYSPDELREETGDEPLGEEWSQAHYLSLNFTPAQNLLNKQEE